MVNDSLAVAEHILEYEFCPLSFLLLVREPGDDLHSYDWIAEESEVFVLYVVDHVQNP
jgi:hypothetical protein